MTNIIFEIIARNTNFIEKVKIVELVIKYEDCIIEESKAFCDQLLNDLHNYKKTKRTYSSISHSLKLAWDDLRQNKWEQMQ